MILKGKQRWKEVVTEKLIQSCLVVLLILITVTASKATMEVTLNDDGDVYHYHVRMLTVAELLENSGIVLRDEDLIEPAPETPLVQGMEIKIQRAFPIWIQTKNSSKCLWTRAAFVECVLNEAGVVPGELDEIYPDPETPLRPYQTIVLTNIEIKEEIEVLTLSFEEERKEDPGILRGRTRVLQEGDEGLKHRIYKVVYADGAERTRELKATEVIKEPLPHIIGVGTAEPKQVILASRDGAAVTRAYTGTASWYGGVFHGRRTASGEIFDKTAMTAAHPTLPFGTMVRVTFLRTDRSVVVEINDRGPFIGTRIIDLSKAAAEAIGLKGSGVGQVKIEILEN